jgi:hypothetical protein
VIDVLAALQAGQPDEAEKTCKTPQTGVVAVVLRGFLRDRGGRGCRRGDLGGVRHPGAAEHQCQRGGADGQSLTHVYPPCMGSGGRCRAKN